jgi:predicted SAM-dependent methyltransferase
MKIEVGAGAKGRDGYVHVDAVPLPGVDVVDDGRWLEKFEDESADEIYAHWFLEHVNVYEIPRMFEAWKRVLKPGGVVSLITNNFEAHNKCLADGEISWDEWVYLIFAANKVEYNIWDLHKSGWNQARLTELLEECGFVDVDVEAQWRCREVDGRLKCPGLIAKACKP